MPLKGDAIGKITIPAIGVDEFVVEGTDTASLRKGPGHYPSTPLPGERGTTAIAGHRTTYGAPFRRLDKLKRGDRITLDMPYGRFVYRVERLKIVDDQDLSVLTPRAREPADPERLPSALQRRRAHHRLRAAGAARSPPRR